jgi:hypothetical protein
VFTGHTASCNGGPTATTGRSVTVDTHVDGATLKAKKTQKQKGKGIVVTVKAGAAEAVTVAAKGKIKAGRKSYSLKPLKKAVAAGKRISLKLKLRSAKDAPAVARALGGKVKASVSATFTDASGNKTTKRVSAALTD